MASIPVVGQEMRTRMKGVAPEARARFKTGTLRNSSALAGYVTDRDGSLYIVVAILNDDAGLVLENGSGLSREERIRPTQLAAVLRAALASPWAPEFVASLPIAAVDGGVQTRLRGGAAARRARLKTGTLRNASALAGVVKDTRGESYILVAMVNDDAAAKDVARPVLDALVEWVASRGFAGTTP